MDSLAMNLLNETLANGEPPSPDNVTCNYYTEKTKHLVIYSGYGYVPENLLINFVAWMVLLFLFTILRKKAWNYGRIALVQKNEQRALLTAMTNCDTWTQLFYGEVESPNSSVMIVRQDPTDVSIQSDRGFCSWVEAIFRIKDDHILRKNGHDAVHYLSFQRHIICYLCILCIICLAVILPVNLQGDLVGEQSAFGRTTISNLQPTSNLLWIHVFCAFLLLPIGVYLMRRFSVTIKSDVQYTSINRTLMITHVPKENCSRNVLLQHFREAYPGSEMQDIQFAYNISTLMNLDQKKEAATEARLWCEAYLKEKGERLTMKPYCCSCLSCLCGSGCKEVDAIDFYQTKETKLTARVEQEKIAALRSPLGIVFVTFANEEVANQVYQDHLTSCKCANNPPTSSLSRKLETYAWEVYRAPPPEDVYWEHLSSDTDNWYIRAFVINFTLFLILFFLTTPAIFANSWAIINLVNKLGSMNPLLSEFAPTLMIWLVAALLPVIVTYSDQFLKHWTRSAENHSIMRKSFVFLLFMIIILPSLGLTSAKAFVEWTVKPSNSSSYRWQCIFLPDNGAFFVNYVITSALIGTSLELIRFSELFMYVMRKLCARSKAEEARVQKTVVWEFPFGTQYGWMLLNFATTMIYSISCPLIAPFGLLYMCLKHCVDRYNIYFAYGPSKINRSIHVTAINFVISTVIILQIVILFFLFIRRGAGDISSLGDIVWVTLVGCCFTIMFFVGQMFCKGCNNCSPIMYKGQPTTVVCDVSEVSDRFQGEDADSTSQARSTTESPSVRRKGIFFVAPVLMSQTTVESSAASVNVPGRHTTYGGTSSGGSSATEPSPRHITKEPTTDSTANLVTYQ